MTIAELLELVVFGVPSRVDVNDGYTKRLIRRATVQHETEYFCGAGTARRAGYRRDQRAIAERERRLANMSSNERRIRLA